MSEEPKRINYNLAKAEADKVDEQIIAALQNGNSFRVEAVSYTHLMALRMILDIP